MELLSLLSKGKTSAVWRIFLDNPQREYSQSEVRRLAHVSRATAVAVLRTLVKEGCLVLSKKGNANFYHLAETATNKQLKVAVTVHSLRSLSAIKTAYLFGSAARGEDGPESDIDVFVLGELRARDLAAILEPLSKKLKRRITPVIFNDVEWASMRKKDPAFYERVEKDKIKL